MTTYQLIDSSLISDLQFKIEGLEQRLKSTEKRLTALDLKKEFNQKHDYKISVIFINPLHLGETGIIDEYIFCASLEEAEAKEVELLRRQRQGDRRKILILEEVSFKSAPYS